MQSQPQTNFHSPLLDVCNKVSAIPLLLFFLSLPLKRMPDHMMNKNRPMTDTDYCEVIRLSLFSSTFFYSCRFSLYDKQTVRLVFYDIGDDR